MALVFQRLTVNPGTIGPSPAFPIAPTDRHVRFALDARAVEWDRASNADLALTVTLEWSKDGALTWPILDTFTTQGNARGQKDGGFPSAQFSVPPGATHYRLSFSLNKRFEIGFTSAVVAV